MSDSSAIQVTRIDHVVLRVEDLRGMIAFYTETLDCRLERGPGEIGLAQSRVGDSLIDLVDVNGPLGQKGGGRPDHQAHNVDHVCLLLESWDEPAILSHLENNGIKPGSIETRYGATGFGPSLYFRDPEGNTIELKGARP